MGDKNRCTKTKNSTPLYRNTETLYEGLGYFVFVQRFLSPTKVSLTPCIVRHKAIKGKIEQLTGSSFQHGRSSRDSTHDDSAAPTIFCQAPSAPVFDEQLGWILKGKAHTTKRHPIDGKLVKKDGAPSERMHTLDMLPGLCTKGYIVISVRMCNHVSYTLKRVFVRSVMNFLIGDGRRFKVACVFPRRD